MVHIRPHLLLALGLVLGLRLSAAAPVPTPPDDAAAAVAGWTATIERPDAPAAARLEALIRRGETHRSLGRLDEAEADLRLALEQARETHADLLQGVATYALGQLYAQQHRGLAAEELLRSGLVQAQRLGRPALTGALANSLGAVLAQAGRTPEARAHYTQALELAQAAGDEGLTAAVRRNLAHLDPNPGKSLAGLRAARAAAMQVAAAPERAQLLLGIGDEAVRLGGPGRALAEQTLREAAAAAQAAGLARERAQALGELGRLSEDAGRATAALSLTEQAVAAAPVAAHDLLYPWEWRLGRLHQARGDRPRATAAYRRAVDHLEQVRHLIPIEYDSGRSSFRETLGPIYLGLADLLMQQAAENPGAEREQALLLEAQQRVEQIKLDELRDYLRDACLLPLRKGVESMAPTAAVLYPVIFPGRLELLVRIGARMYRFTSRVDAATLGAATVALRRALRDRGPIPPAAQSLYDWLIAPIAPLLAAQSVTTLAVVPDGPLRTIPFAALADHGTFLVERYALATVPGLTLLDPQALPGAGLPTLLAGLSRPGPVVGELPPWWLNAMLKQYRGTARGGAAPATRGVAVRDPAAGGRGFTPSVPVPGPVAAEAGTGTGGGTGEGAGTGEAALALALPGVRAELDALARLVPAQTLLDEGFRLAPFLAELGGHSYRIVHIASHGLFGGSPGENFILTYDKRLDMGTLAAGLRPKQLSQSPIELLVLSACQTAEGDDRTPLGLAGIALQSGARGALGSLWPVDDAATQALMRRFYENLSAPGATKGRALQEAQLALLREGSWRDPYYWAPFILVGNWL